MYTLLQIKNNIIQKINKALDKKIITLSDLDYPPNSGMGDLSLPLFKVGKELRKAPNEVGDNLLKKIKPDNIISSLKIIGPYLNFFINKEHLIETVLNDVKKSAEKYGELKLKNKEKILIEFSNVNTHKEYHVGHLRNICLGDAVTKILNT